MRMNTTLVINSKGGSGKTTVTTNIASYFAARNIPTAIMDYDPQGSCLNWLRLRPALAARIHGANAAPQKGGRLRSVERSEEHTSELQSQSNLVCRLLLEKKKTTSATGNNGVRGGVALTS